MQQVTEIKQQTLQIKPTVTAMLHDRRGESAVFEPFFGLEIVEAASDCGVSLGANAFFIRPSLSRNLTASRVFRRRHRVVTRLAVAPLERPEKFSVGMPFAISTCLFSEADPTKTGQWAPKLNNAVRTEQPSCVQA